MAITFKHIARNAAQALAHSVSKRLGLQPATPTRAAERRTGSPEEPRVPPSTPTPEAFAGHISRRVCELATDITQLQHVDWIDPQPRAIHAAQSGARRVRVFTELFPLPGPPDDPAPALRTGLVRILDALGELHDADAIILRLEADRHATQAAASRIVLERLLHVAWKRRRRPVARAAKRLHGFDFATFQSTAHGHLDRTVGPLLRTGDLQAEAAAKFDAAIARLRLQVPTRGSLDDLAALDRLRQHAHTLRETLELLAPALRPSPELTRTALLELEDSLADVRDYGELRRLAHREQRKLDPSRASTTLREFAEIDARWQRLHELARERVILTLQRDPTPLGKMIASL